MQKLKFKASLDTPWSRPTDSLDISEVPYLLIILESTRDQANDYMMLLLDNCDGSQAEKFQLLRHISVTVAGDKIYREAMVSKSEVDAQMPNVLSGKGWNVALTRKGVILTWQMVRLVTVWLACYEGKASYKRNSDNNVLQETKWRRKRYLGSRSRKAKRLYGTYVRYALYKATENDLTVHNGSIASKLTEEMMAAKY